MAGIDAIKNQSLYFAATQEAARQKAREASKNSKTATAKKSVFANALQKKQEEFNLASEGLPIELAGMEIEEAVVFLKDELDSAGDKLASDQSLEQIENYRKKLIADYEKIEGLVRTTGAAFCLSGAGPTLLCITQDPKLEEKLSKKLDSITEANWEMIPLHVEFQGARVIKAE